MDNKSVMLPWLQMPHMMSMALLGIWCGLLMALGVTRMSLLTSACCNGGMRMRGWVEVSPTGGMLRNMAK